VARYAFHESALKHGYEPDEIAAAWEDFAEQAWLEDDMPGRLLRVGFDGAGRPVEVVGVVFEDGARVLFIHMMELRKSTIRLLKEAGR